jgi:hypothetical protein
MKPSPFTTPNTVLMGLHYEELGLKEGWNNERVHRLCRLLRVTPHELGRACCVDFRTMSGCLARNKFPPHISLHFALIESWHLEAVQGCPQKPLIPIGLLS